MCPISGYGSSVSSVLSNVEVKEVRRVWGFALLTHTRLAVSVLQRQLFSKKKKKKAPHS